MQHLFQDLFQVLSGLQIPQLSTNRNTSVPTNTASINQNTTNNPITPLIPSNNPRVQNVREAISHNLSENTSNTMNSNTPSNNIVQNPTLNNEIISTTVATNNNIISEPNGNQIDTAKNENNLGADIEE